jgi:hypothetical protein
MPGVYLVDVIGEGTRANPIRPNIPRGVIYGALMVDSVRGRALIVAADTNLIGVGITPILIATTRDDMRMLARSEGPTGQRRAALFTLLRAAGWADPSGTTWRDLINSFARRIEPAADLDLVDVG